LVPLIVELRLFVGARLLPSPFQGLIRERIVKATCLFVFHCEKSGEPKPAGHHRAEFFVGTV
jgi:hypothetical protein